MAFQTTSTDMSQDKAQWLFEEGATLVFLDVPKGTEFGIDYNSWEIGENFKGVKMIPPGVHFMYYSAVGKDGQVAPRTGFMHCFGRKEILIKKWDKLAEDIAAEPIREEERERIEANKQDLDRYLGAYPYDNYKKWVSLSNFITAELVSQLSPLCGRISSVSQLQSVGSNTQSRRAAAAAADSSTTTTASAAAATVNSSTTAAAVATAAAANSNTTAAAVSVETAAANSRTTASVADAVAAGSTTTDIFTHSDATAVDSRTCGYEIKATTACSTSIATATDATHTILAAAMDTLAAPDDKDVSMEVATNSAATAADTAINAGISESNGSAVAATDAVTIAGISESSGSAVAADDATNSSKNQTQSLAVKKRREDQLLPDMKPIPGTEIRFSLIPRNQFPVGTSSSDVTRYSMDHSYILKDLINSTVYAGNYNSILGEMQFAFICFLIGQVFEGFEHWKRLTDLLCSCVEALTVYPTLYLQFITVLHYHITEIPEDFFVDIVSRENFLTLSLCKFFENLETCSGEGFVAELQQRGVRFRKHLEHRFDWDFGSETGEYAPTIVTV